MIAQTWLKTLCRSLGLAIFATFLLGACSDTTLGRDPTITAPLPATPDGFGIPRPWLDESTSDAPLRQASVEAEQELLGDQELLRDPFATEDTQAHTMQLFSVAGEPAWAIYRYSDLADMDQPLSIETELVAPFPDTYWVGLGDIERGCWRWQRVSGSTGVDTTPVPAGLSMITPAGKALVAVVGWAEALSVARITLAIDVDDEAPVASFEVDPLSGNSPLAVAFDASGSSDRGGGGIVSYEWDWDGDGEFDETNPSAQAQHTFVGYGIHHPRLRVTDFSARTDVAEGQVYLQGWKHTWGTNADERISAVAVDSTANVVCAGTSSHNGGDLLLVKYGRFGEHRWHRWWGTERNDAASSVDCDWDGNIYVAGVTDSAAGAPDKEGYLCKLSSDGELLWQKAIRFTENSSSCTVEYDGDQHVYVAGSVSGSASAIFVMKFTLDGSLVWQKVWEDEDSPYYAASAMARSRLGDIYVAGYYVDLTVPDALFLKFGPEGELLADWTWGADYSMVDMEEQIASLKVDYNGDLYAAGSLWDGYEQEFDTLLVAFSAAGSYRWHSRLGVLEADERATDVCVYGGYMLPITIYVVINRQLGVVNNLGLLCYAPGGSNLWQKTLSAGIDEHGYACAAGPGPTVAIGGGAAAVAAADWLDSAMPSRSISTYSGNPTGTVSNSAATIIDLSCAVHAEQGVFDSGAGGTDSLAMCFFPADL